MTEVYLALGSNMGNKTGFIKAAYALLNKSTQITIEKTSSFYLSTPYKATGLNYFVNSVIKINTTLSPFELLAYTQNIEKVLHRTSKTTSEYQNRTIDIDILYYGNLEINEKNLVIPHKDLQNRDFVRIPFLEIEPLWCFEDRTLVDNKVSKIND